MQMSFLLRSARIGSETRSFFNSRITLSYWSQKRLTFMQNLLFRMLSQICGSGANKCHIQNYAV